MKHFTTHKIDGIPTLLDHQWQEVIDEAAKHIRARITVESYSEEKEHSDGQRRWFKGILLPGLSKDNGDSIDQWETRLKLAVLPDSFKPVSVVVEGKTYTYIPSIAGLSMKNMNILIEGSVARCHGWGFMWVTLPDSNLKSEKLTSQGMAGA